MSLLLDTHALLWWLVDDPRLSRTARERIADPSTAVYVSAATAWEIATKHRLGKLEGADAIVADFTGLVTRAAFEPLPISLAHAMKAGSLPGEHRDPFDRMIAAQALMEGLEVVTSDAAISALGARSVF